MLKTVFILLFFILDFFLFSQQALAHDGTLSYTTITSEKNVLHVVLTTPISNIENTKSTNQQFLKTFEKGMRIENNGEKCRPELNEMKKITESKSYRYNYRFLCQSEIEKIKITYNLFFTLSPTHENITDFVIDKKPIRYIFSSTKHTISLDIKAEQNNTQLHHFFITVINFLRIGILHILSGYDHILFLIGLLLITTNFRQLLKIVTSFTIAHSLTLSLAVLNIALLPVNITESLIALSIAYIAFENMYLLSSSHRKSSKRWIITFLFGLIHGFGFSTLLREIQIPTNDLFTALISFNLGVEIGQIVLIACFFPVLLYLKKLPQWRYVLLGISLLLGSVGLIWFIQRAFLS